MRLGQTLLDHFASVLWFGLITAGEDVTDRGARILTGTGKELEWNRGDQRRKDHWTPKTRLGANGSWFRFSTERFQPFLICHAQSFGKVWMKVRNNS